MLDPVDTDIHQFFPLFWLFPSFLFYVQRGTRLEGGQAVNKIDVLGGNCILLPTIDVLEYRYEMKMEIYVGKLAYGWYNV